MGMREEILERAKALLAEGAVTTVLGWKRGEFEDDPSPAWFETPAELDSHFVFNHFCGSNLSRFLRGRKAADGRALALLKPCDSYSLNQMLGENAVERGAVYALGVPSGGMLDAEKLRRLGVRGLSGVEQRGAEFAVDAKRGGKTFAAEEVMLEKCLSCKGKRHVIADETLFEVDAGEEENPLRFAEVSRLEDMPASGRFAFWKNELSRCIRCNACRNACPVCGCVACVFDNPDSPAASKANSECFEERMFHIIRAFHVAGRCTDCGECSRSCPQSIPLHLLNRKFIKDINRLYGAFQSGAAADGASPLTMYAPGDVEPGDIFAHGGGN